MTPFAASWFLSDGEARLCQSDEYRAQCEQLRLSITAKYADSLAVAGFFRRIWLRWQMRCEFHAECHKLTPSPETQWLLVSW